MPPSWVPGLVRIVPLLLACSPEPPVRPAGAEVQVAVEPAALLDAVPRVVRFRVSGAGVPAAGVLLFEDELTSYHEARVRSADLPSTLLARRVAATTFETESGDALVAPTSRLRSGATYTLAALGRGVLTTLVVESDSAAPYAERVFPRGAAAGGSRWVFCGASIGARERVTLEPGALSADLAPGAVARPLDPGSCFHVDVEDPPESGFVVPPPLSGGVALDPSPVSFARATPPVAPASCKGAEVPLGPGCVAVLDDRAVVRSAAAPLLWALAVEGVGVVRAPPPSGRFVITGLRPTSPLVIAGVVADSEGREAPVEAQLATAASMPHVVVNEVLANPSGPEPAQEWVELYNDGASPVALGGFTLGDDDAESPLPALTLEAGAFAVVVPEAFDVGGHLDVPIREGTLVVRVPRLGRSGLSNSGERVTLRSAEGRVVSSFPPIAPAGAGVSVVRETPATLDDDVQGFGASGGRGASPGAPNVRGEDAR